MKKATSTKFIALLLAAALLCAVFSACQSGGESSRTGPDIQSAEASDTAGGDESSATAIELPRVTVLVDLEQSDLTTTAVSDLLSTTPGYGTEFMLLTETVPDIWEQDGQARDAALTRVRTEILAGKGPDLFLIESPAPYLGSRGGSVFQFPKKAMDNHLLLPLDGYIEDSERIEWDKLVPQVMEAGKNDEGQQILPMNFGFDVKAFDKGQFTLEAQLPMTCGEMLESSDPMVQYTGVSRMFRTVFGEIEDNDKDEMLISEEYMLSMYELPQGMGTQLDFPEFYVEDPINERGTVANYSLGGHAPMSLEGGKDYWLLPYYNVEGGITAAINSYAAVNRNTPHPDLSFRVLETIFSLGGQNSDLLKQLDGQPVHMDVPCPGWSSSQWNDSQYEALLGQINAVVFRTPVEQEMDSLVDDLRAAESGEDWPGIVHEHYMKMQMMLGES